MKNLFQYPLRTPSDCIFQLANVPSLYTSICVSSAMIVWKAREGSIFCDTTFVIQSLRHTYSTRLDLIDVPRRQTVTYGARGVT